MTEPELDSAARQDEEVDIWWGAYDARAMVPRWLLAALGSFIALLTAWIMSEPRLPNLLRGVELLLLAFWIMQLGLWIYRVLCIQYRLTTRCLYCQKGYGHPGAPGLPLTEISRVLVERGPLERFARVGRVYIYKESRTDRPVVLRGIHRPEYVAHMVRKYAQRAQEAQQSLLISSE